MFCLKGVKLQKVSPTILPVKVLGTWRWTTKNFKPILSLQPKTSWKLTGNFLLVATQTTPPPPKVYKSTSTSADEALYYSTIYPTPRTPSSLACVQRTQAGLQPNPKVIWPLGLQPSAITILQCAASLAAGGYDRPCGPIESLFILSPARCLIVRPDYTAPSCPTEQLSYSFISRVDFRTLSEGGPLIGQSQLTIWFNVIIWPLLVQCFKLKFII